MGYVKAGAVLVIVLTMYFGYLFVTNLQEKNAEQAVEILANKIEIVKAQSELKFQKELNNYVQANNEKFLAVMSETRTEREKGKAVLADASRLSRLGKARTSRLTVLANRATVRLWADFENLSRDVATGEPMPEGATGR